MNKLGKADLTSVSMFTSIVDTNEKFRDLIESDDVGSKAGNMKERVQQAAVMSVWKVCQQIEEVEIKQTAERTITQKPPTITEEELERCIRLFEAKFYPIGRS